MVGIDPDGVVSSPPERLDGGESLASVGGAVGGGVGERRSCLYSWDRPGRSRSRRRVRRYVLRRSPAAAFAGIVGAVDAAIFFSVNPGVHAVGSLGETVGADAADASASPGRLW